MLTNNQYDIIYLVLVNYFYFMSSNNILFIITVFLLIGIFQVGTYIYKRKIKKEFNAKKLVLEKFEDVEKESIDFYSKNQSVDLFRFISYFIIIAASLLIFDVQAFSVFAIAVGAFIVILKDPIISTVSYIFLVSQYDIGSDIRVNGVLGEVVRIKIFYLGLAGKDEVGEYNGKFFVIPNHLFFQNIVERQELKTSDYTRVVLNFIFKRDDYDKKFKDWLLDFRKILDELLPYRSLKKVGNYKSYAGVKYKLNYDYNDKGEILIKLSFITKPGDPAVDRKEEIIDFIEGSKNTLKKDE